MIKDRLVVALGEARRHLGTRHRRLRRGSGGKVAFVATECFV